MKNLFVRFLEGREREIDINRTRQIVNQLFNRVDVRRYFLSEEEERFFLF